MFRCILFPKKARRYSYVQPWLVAIGGWPLVAIGRWRLAVGGPWGRSLRAVLSGKKIGFLKDRLVPKTLKSCSNCEVRRSKLLHHRQNHESNVLATRWQVCVCQLPIAPQRG